MEQAVTRTLDLAKAHIQMGDLEATSECLLACLFAITAMMGDLPESAIKKLEEHLSDPHEWVGVILPAILPLDSD